MSKFRQVLIVVIPKCNIFPFLNKGNYGVEILIFINIPSEYIKENFNDTFMKVIYSKLANLQLII